MTVSRSAFWADRFARLVDEAEADRVYISFEEIGNYGDEGTRVTFFDNEAYRAGKLSYFDYVNVAP